MAKPTNRKNRSKLTIALVAPILIIIFIVGWTLYWRGQQGTTKQPQKPNNKTPAKQDKIELIAILPQEEQIIAN